MPTSLRKPRIECAHDAMVALSKLKPHPGNPNKHPPEQVRLLAKIISGQGWRLPIVVSKRSGFIVAGHGRLLAAQALKLKEAPVDYQDFATEAEEIAHLIADGSGEATGNEHRRYAFIERVRNLITTKNYAWRKRDECEVRNKDLRAALLLCAECDYDNERKVKDVPFIRKLIADNYP